MHVLLIPPFIGFVQISRDIQVVTGAGCGEPFVGPALEYLDRALSWCASQGLQVVQSIAICPQPFVSDNTEKKL